ncbi:hypothetical protein EYF80_000901 [Liparis tanakae]|uniref:Uncharacterized protein n=1 Tax=Liparis tanakae TaxID=230148 RepID=A0A4Z2JID9_9TELE|nr:hypothetical protein EYF80_000901 [Liparis tanakae]
MIEGSRREACGSREQLSLAFMKVVHVSSRRKRPPMSFLHTRPARENTVRPQSCSTAFSRKKKQHFYTGSQVPFHAYVLGGDVFSQFPGAGRFRSRVLLTPAASAPTKPQRNRAAVSELCQPEMKVRRQGESSRKKVDPKGDTISKTCKGQDAIQLRKHRRRGRTAESDCGVGLKHQRDSSELSLTPPEPCVLFVLHREALCAGGCSAHGL